MDINKTVIIVKASGDEEAFEAEKLKRSLRSAGAEHKVIEKIAADIDDWIYTGATTGEIYSRAFAILRREKTIAALRYGVKKAIMELGPTGYPFENFVGQIFEKQGYMTEVGVTVEGICVSHEIDVIATNENIQYLIECKYIQDQGKKISVQVPLYVRSRVDDIVAKRKKDERYRDILFSGCVVTNTRFSDDSMQYGECSGLHLVGWDYPGDEGLKDIIEKVKMYPITVLNRLTKKQKHQLLAHGIVTCIQLLNQPDAVNEFGLSDRAHKALINELEDICG
jgi:hypothetical protein